MATGTVEYISVPQIDIEQETKTVTVREVWEALKKNGLKHIRSAWYYDDAETGQAIGGCALGQAAYNLGVPAHDEEDGEDNLYFQLNQFDTTDKWSHYGEGAAEAIITINDARSAPKDGDYNKSKYRYTYKEIVRISHEILEPHFDKTITLPVYRY